MAGEPNILQTSIEIASGAPIRDAEHERERRRLRVTTIVREGSYVRVGLDAPAEWRALHTEPGQYITARFGETRHRFLVLATAPFETRSRGYELLVEPNEDLAPILDEMSEGDIVLGSAPEGTGFGGDAAGELVQLFASGSGIAGIRPLLAHWSKYPESRPLDAALHYEEDLENPHVFGGELQTWAEQGWLTVDLVTRSLEDGFLHEQFDESVVRPQQLAYLCGSPAMMAAVSERLLLRGIPRGHIYTNI